MAVAPQVPMTKWMAPQDRQSRRNDSLLNTGHGRAARSRAWAWPLPREANHAIGRGPPPRCRCPWHKLPAKACGFVVAVALRPGRAKVNARRQACKMLRLSRMPPNTTLRLGVPNTKTCTDMCVFVKQIASCPDNQTSVPEFLGTWVPG